MENKQTAVEWLQDNIMSNMTFTEIFDLIEQAKEMETQQMKYSEEDVISYAKYFASHNKAANFAKPLKPSEWYSL